MSKIIHPCCWRLDDAGKLRFDVPIVLGMRVFEMWRRGPITSFVVDSVMADGRGIHWIGSGLGGSEPQHLFLTERAAEIAKAMRRPPKLVRPAPTPRPHELAAMLIAHPTCRLRRGRRTLAVPLAIGMEVFVHRRGNKTVGPAYVEAITDGEILCSLGDDANGEIRATADELFATGKAERPTEIS